MELAEEPFSIGGHGFFAQSIRKKKNRQKSQNHARITTSEVHRYKTFEGMGRVSMNNRRLFIALFIAAVFSLSAAVQQLYSLSGVVECTGPKEPWSMSWQDGKPRMWPRWDDWSFELSNNIDGILIVFKH